jgi:hypothetical protein
LNNPKGIYVNKIVAMLVAVMVGIGSVSAFAADEMKTEGAAPSKKMAKKAKHKAVKKATMKKDEAK